MVKTLTPANTRRVESLTHDEARRRNVPTAEYLAVLQPEQQPKQIRYPRNTDRNRQLVWRRKVYFGMSDIECDALEVCRIWQKIDAFTQKKDVTNSLSILLEADPAVGKSFLAKKLSNRLECQLIERDITQMIDREELLDLFDTIANAQANSSKPVFVFVDDINATLGGSPVYGAFLSPLEGRKYLRQGQQIELKPCIWMFAGTPRSSGCGDDNWQDEKRADFETRLTLKERIDYQFILSQNAARKPDLDSEAKREQVYLGAQCINVAFSDVIQIDQAILEVFFNLAPDTAPARRIRKLATSLENVQYGRVDKRNCTSSEWQDIIKTLPDDKRKLWTNEPTGDVKWIDLVLK